MQTLELVPAYGRDYKSGLAARIDLAAGKDFILRDAFSRWHGKPVNLAQLRESGVTAVTVRYAGMRKSVRIDISKNIE